MDTQESTILTDNSRYPVTLSSLQKTIQSLRDELLSSDKESPEQTLLKKFIEQQIEKKDTYKNIFRTEQGSIYFILETGESLRIKNTAEEKLEVQPILNHIYFIDRDQRDKLEEMRQQDSLQENIINKPIQIHPCKTGLIPFEFGIEGMQEIHVIKKNDVITITGDNYGSFASGYHIGHKIIEMIK